MIRTVLHNMRARWRKRRRVIMSAGFVLAVLLLILRLFVPPPPLLDGLSYSRAVYDRDGQLLRLTISSDEKYRVLTGVDDVAPEMIDAILLQEDQYFYLHPGVNPVALARAFFRTYVGGQNREGASTITMQVARLRYGLHTRNIGGKILQILRALQLEFYYSKREILAAYLTLIPQGGNIEGVQAASMIYFQKTPANLNAAESLTLSVIPQHPAVRVPGEEHPDLYAARERLRERFERYYPQYGPVTVFPKVNSEARSRLPFRAPHFTDTILRLPAVRRPRDLAHNSLIRTTLRADLQRIIERHVHDYVALRSEEGLDNAAVLLADVTNGEVLAMQGSADFFNTHIHGQINGTRTRRSPGSTLKPFVYALAFDQGVAHPMMVLKDVPTQYGVYSPENYDLNFAGPVRVRDALIRSRNIPALHLAAQLNEYDLYALLKRAGVWLPLPRENYGLTLTLGSAEISMANMAELYMALANGGVWQPLRYVTENNLDVIDHNSAGGQILHATDNESSFSTMESHRFLFSAEAAYLVLDILKDNPRPGDRIQNDWVANRAPVIWKTGTSYSFRDGWSIALFDRYVLAVWVGDFAASSRPVFKGREGAAPLLFRIIDGIRSSQSGAGFDLMARMDRNRLNLKRVSICPVSGALPGSHCPHTISADFIPGRSPIHTCEIHREVLIDANTGYRICSANVADVRAEVYEVWPTDMQSLFESAGLPRRQPPPYDPTCRARVSDERGMPPRIQTPGYQTVYAFRLSDNNERRIPLRAVADGNADQLYWFVNNALIGSAPSGETLFWAARPGTFEVRVLDNFGRGASRRLVVEFVE